MKIVIGVLVVVITLLIYWVAKLLNEIKLLEYNVEDYQTDLNTYKNNYHRKCSEVMELNNTIRNLKPEVKVKVLDHMAAQQREILEEQYSK